MTDPVDVLIGEIQTELCRFSRANSHQIALGKCEQKTFRGIVDIYYTIGVEADGNHKALPCVSWVETGGKTEAPSTSTEDTTIFNDVVRLVVTVQARDKESCRLLWMNLRNATKRVAGDMATWGNYTAPTEEKVSNLHTVFALKCDVDLTLSIEQNPQRLPGFPEPIADYQLRPVLLTTDLTP
jgi:hypothetical protein